LSNAGLDRVFDVVSDECTIVDSNCPNVDLISVLCDVTVLRSCFISCDGWTKSIQSESNHALMQPFDNKKILQNSFQDSVNNLDRRFGWNEQLERWKWLKALQEAKLKPKSVGTDSPVVSNSKNTESYWHC
jgi:hypothetical protein